MDASKNLMPAQRKKGSLRGVRMIYAPEIDAGTFLHLSWQNERCALRNYSKSPTIMPVEDRSIDKSDVWKRVRKEIPIRNRKPVEDTAYWHETTINLNRAELSSGPDRT